MLMPIALPLFLRTTDKIDEGQMLQRYFIYFSYDGGAYHGWQSQPGDNTVQAEMERALSLLLRHQVKVTGAGRTDAGVHARMMVAHFDLEKDFIAEDVMGAFTSQLTYKLNGVLPADIAVDRIEPVDESMHARFSAVSRTYYYYVHRRKDPFLAAHSLELAYSEIDFDAMNAAATLLMQYDDFASFCKSQSDNKTTLCRVTEARWVNDAPGRYHFVITADRFLRNMVRAIVGTLLKVGRGKLSVADFRDVIERRDRCAAGDSAPAHGLFLHNIEY